MKTAFITGLLLDCNHVSWVYLIYWRLSVISYIYNKFYLFSTYEHQQLQSDLLKPNTKPLETARKIK